MRQQGFCSFYPEDKVSASLYSFESTEEALGVVKRITNAVGLEPNFKVLQANVPNAAAVIEEQERLILYSLVFIQQITKSTATEWSAWTILAHEIGHHLNGHTLLGAGSRPPLELQADRFAGHAVRLMGGSIEQALAAYQGMSAEGTDTHPPKSARLEAVTNGWTDVHTSFGHPDSAGAGEGALRQIIEALQTGAPPYNRMTPALADSMKREGQIIWKLKEAGTIKEIKVQGHHSGADGIAYSLLSIVSERGKLSCVLGTDTSGMISIFYLN